MPIGNAIADAWHKHPYLIIGAGGVIALYFLWPHSQGAAPAQSSGGSGDYQSQLAAQLALSQAQISAQSATAINGQNTAAAEHAATLAAWSNVAGSIGAANVSVAEANAAMIASSNQTAQTIATQNANLAIAQTQAGSTDFAALVGAVTDFGKTSSATQVNPVDTFLTSVGPSNLVVGPNGGWSVGGLRAIPTSLTNLFQSLLGGGQVAASSNSLENVAGYGVGAGQSGAGANGTGGGGSEAFVGANVVANDQGTLVARSSAFQPDLYASLITKLIAAHPTFVPVANQNLPAFQLPSFSGVPQMAPLQTPALPGAA